MIPLLALDVLNVGKTILGIGGLIFVHELGHFLVGRACGVKAEAFSIGFGHVLAKWKPGETEYRLSAIPLGGYVKFAGENPEERGDMDPRSFHAATYPRKVAIMLAGVAMNVLAAFTLFFVAFSAGVEQIAPVVGGVVAGSPAEKAGLQEGDRVVELNGHRVLSFEDIQQETMFADAVTLVVRRGDALLPPLHLSTAPSEIGRGIGVLRPVDPTRLGVIDGGVAEKSGLRTADRLVAVEGTAVASLPEAQGEHARAAGNKAAARWTVERGEPGEAQRVEVEVPTRGWIVGLGPVAAQEDGLVRVTPSATGTSPARDAGIVAGSVLVAAGGLPVDAFEDLAPRVQEAGAAGKELVLTWRDPSGKLFENVAVKPAEAPNAFLTSFGLVSIARTEIVRSAGVLDAFSLGLDRTHRWVARIFGTLRSLVSGSVSAKHLQGPIAIARMGYQTAGTSAPYFFLFLGIISMNLAVLNVLPIPLLDGGQLAVITIEKIRGKALPEKVLGAIQWSGLIALLGFMVFVIVNDIRNL